MKFLVIILGGRGDIIFVTHLKKTLDIIYGKNYLSSTWKHTKYIEEKGKTLRNILYSQNNNYLLIQQTEVLNPTVKTWIETHIPLCSDIGQY